MPTTTLITPSVSVGLIGARTDDTGAAVTDYTAEEARLLNAIVNGGYLKPTNAFVVQAQASPNMTVRVGSGSSKADHFVVPGTAAGQGNYLARLDETSRNVTISAASASQARIDEIYLIVQDLAYDSSGRALPRLAYRQGDPGGAIPGVDSAWRASYLLARISVAANATSITQANISDMRSPATLSAGIASGLLSSALLTSKGDLVTRNASGPVKLASGADRTVLTADSSAAEGVAWTDLNQSQFWVTAGQVNTRTSSTTTDVLAQRGPSSTFVASLKAGAYYVVEGSLTVFAVPGTRPIFRFGAATDTAYWVNFDSLDPGTATGTKSTREYGVDFYGIGGQGNSNVYTIGRGGGQMTEVRFRVLVSPSSNTVFGLQYGSETAGNQVTIHAGWMSVTRVA